ncbi:MAG TPA: hypothetical protein VFK70_03705, partial [Vicinamibacteria bacterium]|nr:hypothetical protein [Vicinamibacteria bacterium]
MKALAALLGLMVGGGAVLAQEPSGTRAATPPDLVKLAQEFRTWRRGERGDVDYAARVAAQRQGLPGWRQRFEALKRDDWPVSVKV